jgi:hypothetical protein
MIVPRGGKSQAIDVSSVSWAFDFSISTAKRPVGIHCNAETTIVGALMRDTAERTWVLSGGLTHPLAFRSINASSTTKSGFAIIYEL